RASADRAAVVPRYDAASVMPAAASAPTLSGVTALGDNALAEVLIGRDRMPAWRGRGTRQAAALSGWAGWLVVAAFGVALTIGGRAVSPASWQQGGVGWLAVVLAVSAALPLAPRYGLLAWRVAFLGVLVSPLIPGQSRADGGFYAVLAITIAVAGIRYGPRHGWWMSALSLIPAWLWTGPDWVYPAVNTGWLALLALAVHGSAYWRRDRRELVAQTENAEQQRERNAVLEERARIAREMHDVVAHHMSMIAVQAETASYRLAAKGTETPWPVAEEFAALSAAAREALTDMRQLLGVLRSDTTVALAPTSTSAAANADNSKKRNACDGSGADRMPQPRLEDIPELVEAARRAGAKVTLAMPEPADGPVSKGPVSKGPVSKGPVPAGPGLAAYRIVQESLSNAARHASGAEVSVRIAQAEGALRVTVVNDPPAMPRNMPRNGSSTGSGDGHGITGMRERAALLGGTLDAGPAGDGGFTVRALLPLGTP
ncbi:MAG: histidine kinase, partial [Trebonia sp.]